MRTVLTAELKMVYPKAVFGSLVVREVPNRKRHEALEDLKCDLERKIREVYVDVDEDGTIQGYDIYFKRWGKTYPVEFQIKTIKGGGRFPQISVLVDGMFLAELKNRILTSGHDLDAVQGDLVFDVSEGSERYLKLDGREQKLNMNDVILKDEEGILASVLYGPARRTSITSETRNAHYFAWCPYGMGEKIINAHLNDILSNLGLVFESITSEIQIHK